MCDSVGHNVLVFGGVRNPRGGFSNCIMSLDVSTMATRHVQLDVPNSKAAHTVAPILPLSQVMSFRDSVAGSDYVTMNEKTSEDCTLHFSN